VNKLTLLPVTQPMALYGVNAKQPWFDPRAISGVQEFVGILSKQLAALGQEILVAADVP
jgi:hypothetical protein